MPGALAQPSTGIDNRAFFERLREVSLTGPLAGIKVVDLSRVLAGPWCSQLLGDYGAEIIKIERPGTGDDTRHWGPPWAPGSDGRATGESAYFLSTNRNKRSMTVDISHPLGQRIVKALVSRADVVLENFRVGSLVRYGLDADSLMQAHPRLVYCSISAYGQSGPRSAEPGYDAMIQASAGLMSLTGARDDEGGGPQKVGVAISDIMAGMYATTAILAALQARERSGQGQHVDVPLYDSQVAWLANQAMNYLVGGEVPKRLGTAHPNIVPYQAFATSDGHVMLAVGNDGQFRRCVACLGCPELADDARYASNARRVENRDDLIDEISRRVARQTTEHWMGVLREADVPAGPINDLGQVLTGEYAESRQFVRSVPHAGGQVPTVANPVHFSHTPVSYRHGPPLLGQDTHSLLRDELGYSADDIAELEHAGVI